MHRRKDELMFDLKLWLKVSDRFCEKLERYNELSEKERDQAFTEALESMKVCNARTAINQKLLDKMRKDFEEGEGWKV
jgi:hypothetical protein